MKKYDRVKVYNILKDLHQEISTPKKMSLFNFLSERNSSKKIGVVLIKTGIVSKKDLTPGGRSSIFKWNSIIPNYKMVDAVIYEARKKTSPIDFDDSVKVLSNPIDDNIGYWSKFENANYLYSLAEENTEVKSEEVNQPIEEEKDFLGVDITNVEICDNGTTEKLKQLQEESENSIHKIGELHEVIENYQNMVKNLNNERQHNIDKILDQNRRIEELSNYKNETLYSTKELKNEVEKWHKAYNEMEYKLERQVKIANELHQQIAVLNKKQKDRAIKNFTLLWGMIKINY